MHKPVSVNGIPNLLELVGICPLDPSEMLAIDRGTVFDGSSDSTDQIEPSDGPSLSLCEDGPEFSTCADGPTLSACADGVESEPSDVRLKTDIEHVGATVYGLPLYHFRYKTGSERFEGVMAHDVLKVMPSAVVTGEDGYCRVNYGRLGIRMTRA